MTARCREYAVVRFLATGEAALNCDREPGHLGLHHDRRTGIRWSWNDPESDDSRLSDGS